MTTNKGATVYILHLWHKNHSVSPKLAHHQVAMPRPFVRNILVTVGIAAITLLLLGKQERRASFLPSDTSFRAASIPEGYYSSLSNQSPAPTPTPKPWPALNTLVQGPNITADVQFMLDFAIIAHPKTATTFTMNWLASHDDMIQMYKREIHALQEGKPADLIRLLYDLKPGYQYKRGYKAPRDIVNAKVLEAMAKYFPQTRLVVGLRHPVLWFESFYNFRIRGGVQMPPAETLMGKVQKGWEGVSTDEAKFHMNLDNLRKTARNSEEELALLEGGKNKWLPASKNPVFLYETNQLHDTDKKRADLYLKDLQEFLGLPHALEPIADSPAGTIAHERPEGVIDICDMKFRFIRAELMKSAVEASIWIREYFLESPDVTVSSPEHFKKLVEEWLIDPCHFR